MTWLAVFGTKKTTGGKNRFLLSSQVPWESRLEWLILQAVMVLLHFSVCRAHTAGLLYIEYLQLHSGPWNRCHWSAKYLRRNMSLPRVTSRKWAFLSFIRICHKEIFFHFTWWMEMALDKPWRSLLYPVLGVAFNQACSIALYPLQGYVEPIDTCTKKILAQSRWHR